MVKVNKMIHGFHHIAISVENIERSIGFYKEFGFEEEKRFVREDLKGKAAMLKLGDTRLEIWEFEDGIAPKDNLSVSKLEGCAILHLRLRIWALYTRS
ncbi:MAG: VOC family protein [Candidatus Liptonbacteria bacterium]|nr:VOC family protein [Candidatus Liptonbacteria bacterium]